MTELLNELSEAIGLMSKRIPANPQSHESLEKRLENELVRYFKNLEDAIDINALEQIYYKGVVNE